MILAHFTGNDTSSFLLLTGLALLVLGARMLGRQRPSERRRAWRLIVGGVVAVAAGLAAGLVHTTLTSPTLGR